MLTHNPSAAPVPDVTFVDDLDSAIAAAKASASDKYVAVLGADVARQCLDAGRLDEILVCIAPVLTGDDVRRGLRTHDSRVQPDNGHGDPADP